MLSDPVRRPRAGPGVKVKLATWPERRGQNVDSGRALASERRPMSDGESTAGLIETQGGVMRFAADKPLRLDSGARIEGLEVAYNTYGRLNDSKSNAVLVCHALSGDQHAASRHPLT